MQSIMHYISALVALMSSPEDPSTAMYVQGYDMSCGGLLPVCTRQSKVLNAFGDGGVGVLLEMGEFDRA
ncbi:hypothetical protein CFP56_026002 [Quercus suber]|uniref:Uncharacterized protein n=1 Tax=Quercus suber TaxID=58331 RepID=A0AAW0LX65_QUESU